jgi:hypothetical protein
MKKHLSTLLAAFTLAAAGCAGAPDAVDRETEAEIQSLTVGEPVLFPLLAADLYLKPNVVDVVSSADGMAYTLPYGGVVEVPCNTTHIRVRYRYVNGGALGAGAHSNRSFVSGLPSDVNPQAALAAGGARVDWFSHALAIPANTPRTLVIGLDNFGAVPESSEANNVFKGDIVRLCTTH